MLNQFLDFSGDPEIGCDSDKEFDCGGDGKMCIPMERVCNGKNDCGNWADEPKERCGINECSQNLLEEIPGCDQQCIDLPIGYKCACKKGYQLVGNTTCKGQILVPISKIAKVFFFLLPFWLEKIAGNFLTWHTHRILEKRLFSFFLHLHCVLGFAFFLFHFLFRNTVD